MNVLVIGSGAREHALCWRLRKSKKIEALYCAPGNPGTARVAQNVPLGIDDVVGLAELARSKKVGLTIVGPELPLSLGIVDAFQARGLRIFGPTQAAAQLEASKSFAKEIMQAAGVATAACKVFSNREDTVAYLATREPPVVLKADGLASGKGVYVCLTRAEVDEAVEQLFGGLKIQRLVVEEHISGREASFIVATDGTRVVPLASSHDYKRLLDGHEGPNTGGMGSVSPTPVLSPAAEERALQEVIHPVLAEMRRRGTPFQGFLYAGLMMGAEGSIRVLEFNARLGDPECQVIMRRLDSDLLEMLWALSGGEARAGSSDAPLPEVKWSPQVAVCVVLAADGYPTNVRQGDEITGLEFSQMVPTGEVFHAGTVFASNGMEPKGRLLTAGGRVLSVTAMGSSVAEAAQQAYKLCDLVQFRGRQLRRDIGK